jgi:ABC-type sugar transport system ATPase subunit
MTAVVDLRRIGKQFPGVRALHDVSLAIEPGEVLGLVGENGAGKSTLIKILGGVYGAGSFTGEVVVAGKLQAFKSTRDARRAGIAVVHQELSLVPDSWRRCSVQKRLAWTCTFPSAGSASACSRCSRSRRRSPSTRA